MASAGTAVTALLRRLPGRRGAIGGRRVRLHHRRIFVLPSRAGMVYALLLLGIWLGAVNYNNNLAFLLCFLLIGLGISTKIHTFRNLLGVELEMDDAPAVFAGDQTSFPLRLINPGERERIGLEVIHAAGDRHTVDIPPRGTTEIRITVPTRTRGSLDAGEILIRSRFPTGLVTAWSRVNPDAATLVYPRPEPVAPSPPATTGGRRSGVFLREGDDDFQGLRRYQPGDSLRKMAWRIVARGQEPQVKQFASVTTGSVWLRWGDTAGLATEQRLARLCRWVLEAEAAGQQFGLGLPGRRIQPGRGPAHRNRCLAELARFSP